MIIAAIYVEQARHDTSRIVHYAGGDLKRAVAKAVELSMTTTKDCAWIIKGSKPIMKFFKGLSYKPSDTV